MSRAGADLTERTLSTRGFTLIELVAVLVIVGFVTLLTLPVFSRLLAGVELRRSAQEMSAALRYARGEAILHQTTKWIAFDIEEDRYWLGDGRADEAVVLRASLDEAGKATNLYRKVDLEGFSWFDGSRADKVGWVEFYPNGSSSGGNLLLREVGGERMRRIVMEPLTGLSHVERTPDVK